jgi:hypothetical protein
MSRRGVIDWGVLERQLAELFTPDCDPYGASAAALFDKPVSAVSQNDRDIVKRVFVRIAIRRGLGSLDLAAQALRRAADALHEVGSAVVAEDLLADDRNAILADKLRENLRSKAQVKKIATEGFEICVHALAEMGAADVTIERGQHALSDERCTGTLVHDEFTACPVHDVPARGRR